MILEESLYVPSTLFLSGLPNIAPNNIALHYIETDLQVMFTVHTISYSYVTLR